MTDIRNAIAVNPECPANPGHRVSAVRGPSELAHDSKTARHQRRQYRCHEDGCGIEFEVRIIVERTDLPRLPKGFDLIQFGNEKTFRLRWRDPITRKYQHRSTKLTDELEAREKAIEIIRDMRAAGEHAQEAALDEIEGPTAEASA